MMHAMRHKSWLPLAGGLLLSGAALFVLWWRVEDGTPHPGKGDEAVKKWEAAAGEDEAPEEVRMKRDRSPRPDSKNAGAFQEALRELEQAETDDFADSLEKITATWPREDLASAVAALFSREVSEDASVALRFSLLRRWASLAPADAAAWAASLPPGQVRADAFEQVALAWCALDADAAWKWAESLPVDPAREGAMQALAYELSRSDLPLALERAFSLADSPARSSLVEHVFGNWAAADPQSAMKRVSGISDPELRNASLGRIAVAWAESDPHAAATMAAASMEAGAAQDRTIASIVQRWAQQNPDAVRKWVESFPDGPMKQNALEHIQAQTTEAVNKP
jgi:hypothetical protein